MSQQRLFRPRVPLQRPPPHPLRQLEPPRLGVFSSQDALHSKIKHRTSGCHTLSSLQEGSTRSLHSTNKLDKTISQKQQNHGKTINTKVVLILLALKLKAAFVV